VEQEGYHKNGNPMVAVVVTARGAAVVVVVIGPRLLGLRRGASG
jgi:hypothetical protein